MEITHKYDDIIHLPHHVSETRAHMPMLDRAAQFSPFAALTGYGAAVVETARLTDQKLELDDMQKEHISIPMSIRRDILSLQSVFSSRKYRTARHRISKPQYICGCPDMACVRS